jgi:DNA gyrase inhibitor GyrI
MYVQYRFLCLTLTRPKLTVCTTVRKDVCISASIRKMKKNTIFSVKAGHLRGGRDALQHGAAVSG